MEEARYVYTAGMQLHTEPNVHLSLLPRSSVPSLNNFDLPDQTDVFLEHQRLRRAKVVDGLAGHPTLRQIAGVAGIFRVAISSTGTKFCREGIFLIELRRIVFFKKYPRDQDDPELQQYSCPVSSYENGVLQAWHHSINTTQFSRPGSDQHRTLKKNLKKVELVWVGMVSW
ncbi:hypothetical protein I7I51_03781 [Histoplasma capsulatum]|uniref:Uncharacterized protein n=1 Tax=Ajellomyces capsulatus TaxID=5037 RepID=A0A8A1MAG1_AJECA|nr:hypothetical protein I7I51_03781 [Histoplasma capsulatum]